MAVALNAPESLLPVAGVRLSAVAAGIRYQNRNDLVLLEFAAGTQCAGVFTRNAFCAAPVTVARQHLQQGGIRYFLINSGNANAGTGPQGEADALRSCQTLAELGGCAPQQVLPFSTGVIGEPLPVARIEAALPAAVEALQADRWLQAARAIMTTDTVAKGISKRVRLGDRDVTITGMAKGSGMIRPDMATMLAYIATDAALGADALQDCLAQAVDASFNRITVDGDTSTNDACMLAATGAAGVWADADPAALARFQQALNEVCTTLAQAVIRDGEGATKFITVTVEGGATGEECLQVAYTIAHSPLVKTAFFASDPNWGRILAAVGRAGVADLALDQVNIFLDRVCIVRAGARAADYTEAQGQDVMRQAEITITVQLGRGSAQQTVWTTDLSHEYVRINAEYRS